MENSKYLIDLPYETRNLGLACFAIQDDILETLNEAQLKSDLLKKKNLTSFSSKLESEKN